MKDFHNHTVNSLDGRQTTEELVLVAKNNGLSGVAVTEHAEILFFEEHEAIKNITNSIKDVNRIKGTCDIKLYQGIEIGSPLEDIEKTKTLMSLCDYDVILNSVHFAYHKGKGIKESFASMDYSKYSDEEIKEFLDIYFDGIKDTALDSDFDVLCHITYPFRYINGRFNRNIDISIYESRVFEIFEILIKREKSLEINTASFGDRYGTKFNCPCPDEYFLKKYYDLGGRYVTLGSDSHRTNDGLSPGHKFDEVVKILKNIGFDKVTCFEKRKMFFEQI